MKKMILLTSLLIPFFASAGVKVTETKIVSKMLSLLSQNEAYQGGTNQGWVSTGAILRCAIPEGTGNPEDVNTCYVEPIEQDGDPYPNFTDVTDKELLSTLLKTIVTAEYYTGMGQGWETYGSVVRCYDPQGTVNKKDKPYCEIETIPSR